MLTSYLSISKNLMMENICCGLVLTATSMVIVVVGASVRPSSPEGPNYRHLKRGVSRMRKGRARCLRAGPIGCAS